MSDKVVANIHETMDYGKFKFVEGNRDVRHANKIIKSIQEIGLLMSPILVNERFGIIDGQGSFLACKALGLPVRYVIQNGIGVKEAQYLNKFQTNWKLDDYIHSYSVGQEKKESFENLTAVMKQFPEYDYSIIVRAASQSGNRQINGKLIKDGNYEMSFDDMNRAIRRLTILRRFDDALKNVKYAKKYLMALVYVIAKSETEPRISVEQLVDGVATNINLCEKATTVGVAIQNIDFCYNNRRRAENRFHIARCYEDDVRKSMKNADACTLYGGKK